MKRANSDFQRVHKTSKVRVELSLETRFNTYKVLGWKYGQLTKERYDIRSIRQAEILFQRTVKELESH